MNTPDWAGTNGVIESGGHPVASQRRKDGPAVRPYLRTGGRTARRSVPTGARHVAVLTAVLLAPALALSLTRSNPNFTLLGL
jgi:hypothetical protein